MNNDLTRASDIHAAKTSVTYGLNEFERKVYSNAFVDGASWQQQNDQDTGKDIDPVPAWFGLVPVEVSVKPYNLK